MRGRDHAIGLYEANIAAVQAEVPAERLLVHKLGDGWEPLCAHLGVAVPEVPYPQKNSAAALSLNRRCWSVDAARQAV